jgi:Cys-tRNA(Pro)/Cys-tRNA(Cys) deacylase
MPPKAAAATPAGEALRRAGVPHKVHAYSHGTPTARPADDRPSYGLAAAAALGVQPGRIFKTLIASVDGVLVAAVVPVATELDLKRLAEAAGGRRAVMAEPVAAERATGSVVGGISPLGMRRPLPTFVDASVALHETIYVSAGRRGLQVELAHGDLVRLAKAVVVPIGRG